MCCKVMSFHVYANPLSPLWGSTVYLIQFSGMNRLQERLLHLDVPGCMHTNICMCEYASLCSYSSSSLLHLQKGLGWHQTRSNSSLTLKWPYHPCTSPLLKTQVFSFKIRPWPQESRRRASKTGSKIGSRFYHFFVQFRVPILGSKAGSEASSVVFRSALF